MTGRPAAAPSPSHPSFGVSIVDSVFISVSGNWSRVLPQLRKARPLEACLVTLNATEPWWPSTWSTAAG